MEAETPDVPSTGSPFAPRGLDVVRFALGKVPPRVPGSGTYSEYRNLAWGLVHACNEAGGSEDVAVRLIQNHSPSWTDAEKVTRSHGGRGNAAWFWGICGGHGFSPKGERAALTPDQKRAWRERVAEQDRARAERDRLAGVVGAIREKAYDQLVDVVAGAMLDASFSRWDWVHALTESSPIRVPGDHDGQWRTLLETLFSPDDRIFSGGPYDSGDGRDGDPQSKRDWLRAKHARHFLTVGELLSMDRPLGRCREGGAPDWRVTAGTFPVGAYARLKANVVTCKYRLLEFDAVEGRPLRVWEDRDRNQRLSLAVIRWLESTYGLDVCAIVATGSKSLHAWCGGLDELWAEFLADCYGELRPGHVLIDPNVIRNPAMIFRLPGCVHGKTGQSARLIYLKPPTAPSSLTCNLH